MGGLAWIDLRRPNELVEKTDILAKLEYKNRTDVIKSVLTEYLGGVAATQLKDKAVESHLDDKLSYNELAVVIGRQNAESVKVSKDDFKLLKDVLLVPVGPINHHKDFNIRAHIFMCYRYDLLQQRSGMEVQTSPIEHYAAC